MPPKFRPELFKFAPGEQVPEHIATTPDLAMRDERKIYIVGRDSQGEHEYPVAIDVDDLTTAQRLKDARDARIAEARQGVADLFPSDKTVIIEPEY